MTSHSDAAPMRRGRRFTLRPILTALSLLTALASARPAVGQVEIVSVPYSFSDEDSGGAAIVRIEVPSGRILSTEALFDSTECRTPLKIRRSSDGQTVAVTNLDESGPNLMLWSAAAPGQVKGLPLPSLPDEIRFAGRLALLTLEDDAVAAVDLASQQVSVVHQLDKMMQPPANAPEDLAVDPTRAVRGGLVSERQQQRQEKRQPTGRF